MKIELAKSVITTPAGKFSTIIRLSDHAIVASGFSSPDALVRERLSREDHRLRSSDSLDEIEGRLRAYFDGDLAAVTSLNVAANGSEFRTRVYGAMRQIPPGKTATYSALAESAGVVGAARAVGSACRTNPVAVIVPCHRVVRADGSLGNYYYGISKKRWLLDFESRSIR